MIQADRIEEYLQRLTPLARGNLLTELERLELCGAEIPGSAEIVAGLRTEFRKDGSTQVRAGNPARYFFVPLESSGSWTRVATRLMSLSGLT